MDDEKRKAYVQQMFNLVSVGYDSSPLRFFRKSAEKLAPYFQLNGHEIILDNATGTGQAALALASHLPGGKVTGVDLSTGMLAQARINAQSRGIENAEFSQMDIEAMEFADGHFDHANCSFCLFFVGDMPALLSHIRSKVKPGGRIVSTCFTENSFAPQVDLFLERIQTYGIDVPEAGYKRLGNEAKNLTLYENCGLRDIRCERHDVSYSLKNELDWWDIIWFAGFRGLVIQLDEESQKKFKQEHLQDVKKLRAETGLPLHVEVIYTVGTV